MRKVLFSLVAVLLANQSFAVSAVGVESYTINFDKAVLKETAGVTDGGVAALPNVNELQFKVSSYIGFTDAAGPGAGVISPGDKFDDYIVGHVTGFTTPPQNFGSPIFPVGYGSEYQLTFIGHIKGTQTSATAFKVDSLERFEFYVDSIHDGSYTVNNVVTSLGTYTDGALVEFATGLIPFPGANAGTNANANSISGTLDIAFDLNDALVDPDEFETDLIDLNGNPIDTLIFNIVAGLVDSNNTIPLPSVGQTSLQTVADNFGTEFAFDAGDIQAVAGPIPNGYFLNGDFDFGFISTADGSFVKSAVNTVVPEPFTGGLAILGLAGLGFVTRRRRSA